jgi:hypothetical protein
LKHLKTGKLPQHLKKISCHRKQEQGYYALWDIHETVRTDNHLRMWDYFTFTIIENGDSLLLTFDKEIYEHKKVNALLSRDRKTLEVLNTSRTAFRYFKKTSRAYRGNE